MEFLKLLFISDVKKLGSLSKDFKLKIDFWTPDKTELFPIFFFNRKEIYFPFLDP